MILKLKNTNFTNINHQYQNPISIDNTDINKVVVSNKFISNNAETSFNDSDKKDSDEENFNEKNSDEENSCKENIYIYFLEKYKNFFRLGARKLHFPKYKEIFVFWALQVPS